MGIAPRKSTIGVIKMTLINKGKTHQGVTTMTMQSTMSHESLLELVKYDIPSKAESVFNKMKVVLTTPELRWEFVQRRDNSKYSNESFNILNKMRREQLQAQSQQATIDFLHNYRFDPIQAISDYLIDHINVFTFEDWIQKGGTPEKLIELKQQKNDITLIGAVTKLSSR